MLLIYLCVVDSEYVQFVFMKWMIVVVVCVMELGCKVDNVLIFEGKQGYCKLMVLKVLVGVLWFMDMLIQIGNKDMYVVLVGKWVIELVELDLLNKVDLLVVKSFFVMVVDWFCNFYGKWVIDVLCQCVFVGLVNFDMYLKDELGNWCYWLLCVGGLVDIDGIVVVCDQFWVEVVYLYCLGVVWYVEEYECLLFEIEQVECYEGDVYEDKIVKVLEFVLCMMMEEIFVDILKFDMLKWMLVEQCCIGKVLKLFGWVCKCELIGLCGWYYVKEE